MAACAWLLPPRFPSNLKRFSRMPTDWRLSLSVRCLSVRGFFFSLTVRVLDLPGCERVKSIGKPIADVNKPFFPIGGCTISKGDVSALCDWKNEIANCMDPILSSTIPESLRNCFPSKVSASAFVKANIALLNASVLSTVGTASVLIFLRVWLSGSFQILTPSCSLTFSEAFLKESISSKTGASQKSEGMLK